MLTNEIAQSNSNLFTVPASIRKFQTTSSKVPSSTPMIAKQSATPRYGGARLAMNSGTLTPETGPGIIGVPEIPSPG